MKKKKLTAEQICETVFNAERLRSQISEQRKIFPWESAGVTAEIRDRWLNVVRHAVELARK
jgi:hypothetical protein